MSEHKLGSLTALGEGANCQQMSRDEIREYFYLERLIRFDETPCPRFDLQRDLTPEAWSRFVARARIPDDLEPLIALENLHLVRDGQMTHAGAWLLAEDVTKYSLQAAVTCALAAGRDQDSHPRPQELHGRPLLHLRGVHRLRPGQAEHGVDPACPRQR